MSKANILRDRVQIQLKTTTATALGQTEVWSPVETRYALVVPVDVKSRAIYQQMNTEITHKVVMRDAVTLKVGLNRLKWGSKTLEPVEVPQILDGDSVVMVKEVD